MAATFLRRMMALLLGGSLLAGLLVGATPASAAAAYSFSTVVDGFALPTQVQAFPDGSGRVAVVEKRGTIRIVRGAAVQPTPYLSLGSKVAPNGSSSNSEQGLLGLAFGRSFASNPVLFVAYVRPDGALVVSKLRAYRASSPTVRASTEQVLLVVPHPTYQNHNGGGLAFGKDGLLYIATGDGGGGGDPLDRARRLDSLSGKILRIDVYRTCGRTPYCIPDTNPFRYSTQNRRELYAWGLRNPWRIWSDPVTGDLWIGDVGQDQREEVSRIPGGAASGGNLGWPCREGTATFDAARCAPGATYRAPVVDYCHPDAPGCDPDRSGRSVTGGEIYRGSALPGLAGRYVFGDFISGNVWSLEAGAMTRLASLPRVTDFGRGPDGELLAVTYGGGLHRLVSS